MIILASEGCFWPLTASMTSEVKNKYAYYILQDICNKLIEAKNFCGMYGFSAKSNIAPLNILGLLMRYIHLSKTKNKLLTKFYVFWLVSYELIYANGQVVFDLGSLGSDLTSFLLNLFTVPKYYDLSLTDFSSFKISLYCCVNVRWWERKKADALSLI